MEANLEEIKFRIEQLMHSEGLSSKQMAERIGISPSTLSNILGDRNKPSLDVVMLLLKNFPSVSPDWLLNNEGEMLRDAVPTPAIVQNKTVQKILVFYTDGTFEER